MRLLLDTHIVLWQLLGTRRLNPQARDAIASSAELYFSSVSFAEIGVKVATGKLTVPAELADTLRGSGIKVLGLEPEHGLGVGSLPLHHRDPFDRLLISQARAEHLAVVTADQRFSDYDIEVIDAA